MVITGSLTAYQASGAGPSAILRPLDSTVSFAWLFDEQGVIRQWSPLADLSGNSGSTAASTNAFAYHRLSENGHVTFATRDENGALEAHVVSPDLQTIVTHGGVLRLKQRREDPSRIATTTSAIGGMVRESREQNLDANSTLLLAPMPGHEGWYGVLEPDGSLTVPGGGFGLIPISRTISSGAFYQGMRAGDYQVASGFVIAFQTEAGTRFGWASSELSTHTGPIWRDIRLQSSARLADAAPALNPQLHRGHFQAGDPGFDLALGGLDPGLIMLGQIAISLLNQSLHTVELVLPIRGDLRGPNRIPTQDVTHTTLLIGHLGDLFIEQAHVQHAPLKQRGDLRTSDGGDVVTRQPRLVVKPLNLWSFDHAAISDDRDMTGGEPFGKLVDLVAEGHRVGGVAGKRLNRDRFALAVAEQAVHDLPFALLAVALITEGGQVVVRAFQITAGHIVEEQVGLPIGLVKTEQPILDRVLTLGQPVEIVVQVILVEGFEFQHVTGGMRGGQPHRRQPGPLADDTGEDLPEGISALGIVAQGVNDAQALSQHPKGPDGTERQSLPDAKVLVDVTECVEVGLVFEGERDGLNFVGRTMGDIGDGSFPDASIFAIGLSEEVSGVLSPVADVGDGVDIHSGHIVHP
jgi:hypothetical protein